MAERERTRQLYVVTHPEVDVDPAVPVPQWGLSTTGRQRLAGLVQQPWAPHLGHVFCSSENKARQTAAALAAVAGLAARVDPDLGENDRSATGYLPAAQFEALADRFFAEPASSVSGWEPDAAAQQRIVRAVRRALAAAASGDVAVVTHGAVGTLLWCHLQGVSIDRRHDQPGQGSWYAVDLATMRPAPGWQRIPV